jgi:hypothetical protein
MTRCIRSQIWIPGLAIAWASPAIAAPITLISDLRYEASRHAIVFRITGPVAISSRELREPHRYVIDIPDAHWRHANGTWRYQDPYFHSVRVAQFGIFPPVVRIVLECTQKSDVTLAIQQDPQYLYISVASLKASFDDHHHAEPTPKPRASLMPIFAPTVSPSLLNGDQLQREPDIELMPLESIPDTRQRFSETQHQKDL